MVIREQTFVVHPPPLRRWPQAGFRANASPMALEAVLQGHRVVMPPRRETTPLLAALREAVQSSPAASDHDGPRPLDRLLAVTRRYFDAPMQAAEHPALAVTDAPSRSPAIGRGRSLALRRATDQGTRK